MIGPLATFRFDRLDMSGEWGMEQNRKQQHCQQQQQWDQLLPIHAFHP